MMNESDIERITATERGYHKRHVEPAVIISVCLVIGWVIVMAAIIGAIAGGQ